ncbi:MAG: hypothetical protein ACLRL6_08385 [Clostridium sp.]
MTSAMGFVFLQLRPVPYADFLTYLLVMAFSLGFAICCLLIASYGHRKQDDYVLARKGIDLLQKQMTAFLQQTRDTAQKKQLIEIQRALYKQAYQSRGFTYITTKEGKLRYLFALLFQRSSYFLENMDNIPICSEQQQVLLQRCMQFLKHAENFNCTDNSMLLEEGQKLFTACRKSRMPFPCFCITFYSSFCRFSRICRITKKKQSIRNGSCRRNESCVIGCVWTALNFVLQAVFLWFCSADFYSPVCRSWIIPTGWC